MNEDDYRELVLELAEQLHEVGAGDLADDRHYAVPDPETADWRLVAPKDQLVLMLQAFERFLAVRDHDTYVDALDRISQSISSEPPHAVVYEPTAGGRDVNPIDLGQGPDLRELRSEVRAFINDIKESRDE